MAFIVRDFAIYGMVFAGSALMIVNIWRYARFARRLQAQSDWGKERRVLQIPIFLLVMFLFGYLAVGIIGKPDLIVSGILFGGSIFVFIIFLLLQRITDRVRENDRLEAELKAAEENNRMKTAFLSSMSHEMRTPLNAIIGTGALVLRNPDLPLEVREQIIKAGVSATDLLEMINNILDINSIDTNRLTPREEEFSLRDLLADVSRTTRDRCEKKGLTCESQVTGELDDYYAGDDILLRHALLNILGNAVKFTPAPGKVTFTAEQTVSSGPDRALRFIVRDTGIGISQEQLSNLFTSFGQADESAGQSGGLGLGLALSKRVAELMGGDITVDSKPGAGSAFTLTVRLKASERKKNPAPEKETKAAKDAEVSLAGLKVLIVDDIELNAEIAADLLDLEGVSSDRAENGLIAVDMFSQSSPDTYAAILMDLRMPVMDGLDATRAIRALDRPDAKTVPIMALTANAFEEDVRNSMEAGMNAHMPKPVDADSLFENLRRLIAEKKEKSGESL